MTESEFVTFEKSARATVRRISAENTWLRHSLLQLKTRVAAIAEQLTVLEKRARSLKKLLGAPTPTPTSKTARSKR